MDGPRTAGERCGARPTRAEARGLAGTYPGVTVTAPADDTVMVPFWNRWDVPEAETTAAATGNPRRPAGPPFATNAAWTTVGTVWIPVVPAM